MAFANEHIRAALEHPFGDRPGQFAIRGSIALERGDIEGAVKDLRTVLQMRKTDHEGAELIGDAESEFGFALLRQGNRSGIEYMESGVNRLARAANMPGLLTRARRKLATGYIKVGMVDKARVELMAAFDVARQAGLVDQLPALRRLVPQLRKIGGDISPSVYR